MAGAVSRYPSIDIANTAQAINAVGRLRYELFIKRDGKRYAHANHERETFIEPVDDASLNFLASDHQRCLAAARMTWAVDALDDPHLSKVVECSGLTDDILIDTVLCSRLAVRPEMHARLLLTELLRSGYRYCLLDGGRYFLVGVRSHIAELYLRFGFVPTGLSYSDAVAGEMTVIRLDLHDRANLVRVRSPLLVVYDEIIASR